VHDDDDDDDDDGDDDLYDDDDDDDDDEEEEDDNVDDDNDVLFVWVFSLSLSLSHRGNITSTDVTISRAGHGLHHL
jgi:hypothetical protein